MIAASAVLVVIAFVTLIIGIFQTGLGLIWVSIASSVLAAIFLLLGVVKGRPPRVATAGATYSEGAWGDAPAPTLTEAPPAEEPVMPAAMVLDIEDQKEEPVEDILPPRRTTAPARPAASRASTTSRAAASKAPAKARATASKTAAKTPAAQQQVVVIPDRDKFHKTTCRYAKGPGTMKLTKSEARREGYKACGVCKP